jgi:cytochrome c oxidase subunit 2
MRRIIRPLIGVALAATTWSPAISAGAPVHEIQVEAKRFTFVPASIEVTAGEPVRLVIHSTDGTHGFAIRDLKIRLEVPRSGKAVIAEFIAPPPGRYDIACSEVCGRGHRQMKASLVSVAPTPSVH